MCRLTDTYAAKSTRQLIPKLASLTLSRLDFLFAAEQGMLDVLQGRRDCKIGLKRLVIRECRASRINYETLGFKELVGKVEWIDMEEMRSDYDSSEDPDSDESDYYDRYYF
jgi:hypothetical protein